MRIQKGKLPELLAPAGSLKALEAAIDGGADAVYFGAPSFNARIRAQNFTDGELEEAFRLCHAYGVKSYVTLNTLMLIRHEDWNLQRPRRRGVQESAGRIPYRQGT